MAVEPILEHLHCRWCETRFPQQVFVTEYCLHAVEARDPAVQHYRQPVAQRGSKVHVMRDEDDGAVRLPHFGDLLDQHRFPRGIEPEARFIKNEDGVSRPDRHGQHAEPTFLALAQLERMKIALVPQANDPSAASIRGSVRVIMLSSSARLTLISSATVAATN